MEFYPLPEEHLFPPEEALLAGEEAPLPGEDMLLPPENPDLPRDEFAEKAPGAPAEQGGTASRHKLLKRLMAAPLAATIATLSILYAAFPYDVLGLNALSGSSSSFVQRSSGQSSSQSGTEASAKGDGKENAAPADSRADQAFPKLANMNPDFDGKYAWSGDGSEEFVRFTASGASKFTYLEAGEVWKKYDNAVVSSVSGARYDAATNTLTLENFSASLLEANLMGNGFKIRLLGKNRLDQLVIWGAGYAGSVTLTGSGSLAINESGNASGGVGIHLNSEYSQACLMIDRSVTLDVYGEYAIVVDCTSMEKAIWYLSPQVMTGGERSSGRFTEFIGTVTDENGNPVLDENGNPVQVDLWEKYHRMDGVQYYDYSIVGEDNMPSHHVRFAPQ